MNRHETDVAEPGAAEGPRRPGCPVVHGRAFDPLDPVQAADGYAWFSFSQRERPVFYMDKYDLWCVTRYEDALAILRDTQTYSSRKVIDFSKITDDFAEAFPDGRPDRVLVTIDPPEHTRLRKLAQKAFTPKMIAAREPEVRGLVDGLIDAFVANGECDLVTQYADHLPVQAITKLLGAPLSETPRFFQWATERITMLQGAPHLDAGQRRALVDRAVEFNRWLHEFVADRRAHARDDLASALIHARSDAGEPALSDAEVVALIGTILSAGTSTTAHLIPVAIRELLRHPSQWEELRADHSLIPAAVEECLRRRTSVRGNLRTATRDVEIHGVAIPKGADIYVHYAAAQQDPEVFEDPRRFDIHRSDVNKHFAFGRWTHMCLGAPLARLELRLTLERILDRLPDMRVREHQHETWTANFLAPGLDHLWVTWKPSAVLAAGGE